jgi:hypothetical protein
MAYDISGTIKRIGATEQKSEKFSKRTLILDVEDGKYPQVVELQATGDRCGQLDDYRAGDEVSVSFNLRGREWTGKDGVVKVFNSCDIWRIARVGAAQSRGGAHEPAPVPTADAGPLDDCPF